MKPAAGESAVRQRWAIGLLFAFAALAVAIGYASPIQDSDLFWQMAYARQMIERGTLILDHAAFSWTPAETSMVYCAWLAQFALYGLWKLLGLGGLFALRYAALAVIVFLLWLHARRTGQPGWPFVLLVLLVVALASSDVLSTKPELFSVVFTHVVLWSYFRARRSDRAGERVAPWLAMLPLTMLVWVNTHGGFILVAPILLAIVVGELVNFRIAKPLALSPRALRGLLAACALCAVATLATPYGAEYPRQLVADYLWSGGTRADVAWNTSYRSLFSTGAWESGRIHALVLMLAMLGVLAWRRRHVPRARVDFVLPLLVVGTLPLYLLYLRSMYVFVAVFGYVAIRLAAPMRDDMTGVFFDASPDVRRRAGRNSMGQGLCVVLIAAIGTLAIVEAVARPHGRHGWLGFGISTLNPVEEAEYLDQSGFRGPLYNTFETGGYLIWRLHPGARVMVDARSFPYLAWFDDHYRFVSGDRFDEFLAKYAAADVALIDYAKGPLLRNFARSPNWRLVFVGPCAAVFVRDASDAARRLRPAPSRGLSRLRNAAGALDIFDFTRFAGEYGIAWTIVDQLDALVPPLMPDLAVRIAAAGDYRRGHREARARNYAAAFDLLNGSLNGKVISEREKTILALLRALSLGARPDDTARLEGWLESLLAPPE